MSRYNCSRWFTWRAGCGNAARRINLRRIKRQRRRNKAARGAREGNFIFLHPGRGLTASFITG